jgi:hypothetical protein
MVCAALSRGNDIERDAHLHGTHFIYRDVVLAHCQSGLVFTRLDASALGLVYDERRVSVPRSLSGWSPM